jgi:hypothetical protein
MKESVNNEKQMRACLFFCEMFGLSEDFFTFLLSVVRRYPANRKIVVAACKFITGFVSGEQVEKEALEEGALGTIALTLQLNRDVEEVALQLLKVLHFLSFFASLDSSFVSSSSLQIIIEVGSIWRDSPLFVQEVSSILANLIGVEDVLNFLKLTDILEIIFGHFAPRSYQVVSELVTHRNMTLNKSQFSIVVRELDSKQQISAAETFHLLQIIANGCHVVVPDKKLTYKPFISLLSVHIHVSSIIRLISEILPFCKNFNTNGDLLFALLEALRIHLSDASVVAPLVSVLTHFEKAKNAILASRTTVDILVGVMQKHMKDASIAANVFTLLKGEPAAYPCALTALSVQKDKAALGAAAHCLFTISEMIDVTNALNVALTCLKANPDDPYICSHLLCVVFFVSRNEATHQAIIKHFQTVAMIAHLHMSNLNLARSFVGLVCNVGYIPRNVLDLVVAPAMVVMALSIWCGDAQVVECACIAITHFAQNGRGREFVPAVPYLAIALKNRLSVQRVCKAMTFLVDFIEELSGVVCEELMNLIKREQDKKSIAGCLASIAHFPGSQNAILGKVKILLEILHGSGDDDDELKCVILALCGKLSDKTRMRQFESVVPNLVSWVRGEKKDVAISAANLCLNLASIVPECLMGSVDSFNVAAQQGRGELSRICGNIVDLLSKRS